MRSKHQLTFKMSLPKSIGRNWMKILHFWALFIFVPNHFGAAFLKVPIKWKEQYQRTSFFSSQSSQQESCETSMAKMELPTVASFSFVVPGGSARAWAAAARRWPQHRLCPPRKRHPWRPNPHWQQLLHGSLHLSKFGTTVEHVISFHHHFWVLFWFVDVCG